MCIRLIYSLNAHTGIHIFVKSIHDCCKIPTSTPWAHGQLVILWSLVHQWCGLLAGADAILRRSDHQTLNKALSLYYNKIEIIFLKV